MRIPLYLVVAQWALLFSLGMLVIVMYRLLGRQLSLTKPDANLGPAVGTTAAAFEYARVSDATVQYFTPGRGRAALLAFVGPTCPACEELVVAMGEADDVRDLAGARVLLLISEPPSYLQISEPFRTTRLEIGRVMADATLEAYRASATPLLVAIDGTGIVRSAGPATQLAEVQASARACLLPTLDHTQLPIVPAEPKNGQSQKPAITITSEGERLP